MTQLADLDQFANSLAVEAVKHALLAVVHKLRYPMTDILTKVPGDTLADRARKIGVSRQTMYVWQDERFRPIGPQAKKLAKLTGVPIEHIKEYANDAGRTVAKKAAKLARRRKAASGGDGRTRRPKRGMVDAQGRSGSVRKGRKRTSG